MLFNSVAFFIFLMVVFPLYWKVFNKNLRIRNAFVLLASYVFYGWWDERFLLLIIGSSLVDYVAGRQIFIKLGTKAAKFWIGLSLVVNLGALCFFKYFGFFVDSFIAAFDFLGFALHRPALEIILPVGISFYTFQTLSYSIDVYRGKLKPTHDIIAFFSFVAFFPQLVAGPIERATHLLPQFLKTNSFNEGFAISGLRIMLWGFFKKVVISDNLAPVVDTVFNQPGQFEGVQVWLAAILFTFQLYCDFSGYSDIAIGCGRLFGFDIMTNFKTPLFSKTVSEFWNRWHISLNTWFRDYVYFPLGGNRVNGWRWTWNILVVFALSGLWHGSNWTFLFWGIFNGLLLIYARFTFNFRETFYGAIGFRNGSVQRNFLDSILVFILISFSFIFFRANHAADMFILIENGIHGTTDHLAGGMEFFWAVAVMFTSVPQMIMLMCSLILLCLIDFRIGKNDFHLLLHRKPVVWRWSFYLFIGGWTAIFGAFARPENFIYFQF